MRILKIAAALLGLALPVAAFATVGGANYATQYDFDELRTFTDGKPLRVDIMGQLPFAGVAADDAARQMLPLIQAARPQRLRAFFTYDKPAERPRPEYRLILVFDAADNLNSSTVCAGQSRHKPPIAGQVNIFAVYCRNDQMMSETTGWTAASGPNDPRLGRLFFDLLATVFSDAQGLKPQQGFDRI